MVLEWNHPELASIAVDLEMLLTVGANVCVRSEQRVCCDWWAPKERRDPVERWALFPHRKERGIDRQ